MDKAQAQIIHTLAQNLTASTPKGRGELVQRAALALGKSVKTVYRLLKEAGWEVAKRAATRDKAPLMKNWL